MSWKQHLTNHSLSHQCFDTVGWATGRVPRAWPGVIWKIGKTRSCCFVYTYYLVITWGHIHPFSVSVHWISFSVHFCATLFKKFPSDGPFVCDLLWCAYPLSLVYSWYRRRRWKVNLSRGSLLVGGIHITTVFRSQLPMTHVFVAGTFGHYSQFFAVFRPSIHSFISCSNFSLSQIL